MKKWVVILVLAASCSKPVEDAVPLVFIHGIKGAVLSDERGAVRWLNPRQALNLESPRLALPVEWKGDEQARDGITASGVLRDVYVIPFVLGEKVYGPFLDKAGKLDRPFYPFAYDWRRDNLETLARFIAFLEDVSEKNKGAKIQVVAHSMGGLITRAALAQRPDLFQSVIFAGVAFGGGIGFLPDMHAGAPVGRNKTILSPEVFFTFPSVYTLFQETSSRIF